jgi:sortase A
MITAGVLILLFVAYQLWGTGIRTAQAQNRLEDDFAAVLDDAAAVTSTTASTTTTTDPSVSTTATLPATTAPALPPELLPREGEASGHIVIPRIGVDWIFVEGVAVGDLKEGPGHYPETPLPGQAGNSAIAGHRTTYGAPFANVDQLQPGDEIQITTVQGTFRYLVRATRIVSPSQVEVLSSDYWTTQTDVAPFANALTLTACHPKYSARQRIIIGAELVGQPAPTTPTTTAVTTPGQPEDDGEATIDAGLSGQTVTRTPAVLWGLACAGIWLLAWLIGHRWRRLRWPAYLVFLGPFLVALFFFFENFSRLLPANY